MTEQVTSVKLHKTLLLSLTGKGLMFRARPRANAAVRLLRHIPAHLGCDTSFLLSRCGRRLLLRLAARTRGLQALHDREELRIARFLAQQPLGLMERPPRSARDFR